MKKIYDCFTFFNELHLLEIRLHELNDIVDHFVLVEGQKTWQNKDKPLFFNENKHLFEPFLHKIIHIVVDAPEFVSDSWANEEHSFNCIKLGLTGASDDDIIMVSAVDEIPRKQSIENARVEITDTKHLMQQMYYLFLNTKFGENNTDWPGTCISPWKYINGAEGIYNATIRTRNNTVYIENGGWHFSYSGGVESIYTKLQSFAHTEWVHMTKDDIKHRFENMLDPIERGCQLKFFGVDPLENLPLVVQNNVDKYRDYLKL